MPSHATSKCGLGPSRSLAGPECVLRSQPGCVERLVIKIGNQQHALPRPGKALKVAETDQEARRRLHLMTVGFPVNMIEAVRMENRAAPGVARRSRITNQPFHHG